MNNNATNHPVAHWSQLLLVFTLPGALQGFAFYSIAQALNYGWFNVGTAALWFLAIAPTCFFLTTLPNDRWRSLAVSVVLAGILCVLFLFKARYAAGTEFGKHIPFRVIFLSAVCSCIVIFTAVPFYRTRWQRRQPFHHYVSLFEFAWNQTVCVLIGFAFTGLVAALMALSVALFAAVGVSLEKWVFHSAFIGVWAGAAFATAMGVTRQSDSIVLGARVLLLALLRLLLPVMLPICAVFVVLVAVVGVDAMDTGLSIAFIVLAAGVTGIVLCSARIGDASDELSSFQQWVTRGMSAVVLPLALLATHALWFRVNEHGWTGHRVLAATVIGASVLYGLGYLIAALWNPRRVIPTVNILMAGVCTVLAILLMSPVLDPDRLGVRDQLARFDDGRVSAEQLDLGYLKFASGQVGRDALSALAQRSEAANPPLKNRLEQLASINNRWELPQAGQSLEVRNELANAILSDSFRLLREDTSGWTRDLFTDGLPVDVETAYLEWGLFEFRQLCLQEAKDCGMLVRRDGTMILAIRTEPASLRLYRLPQIVVGEMEFPFPVLLGTLDETNGATQAHLDTWFSALDNGVVPVETVAVPVLAIGDIRVWADSAVLGR